MTTERDIRNQIDFALDKGIEQGLEQGLERGREEGRVEERNRIVDALRAQGISEETIAKVLEDSIV